MIKLITAVIILNYAAVSRGSPQREMLGFTFIGKSDSFFYYLSNFDDKRSVPDARTGCHESFPGGELVMIETEEKHDSIRQRLSSWGITERDRVWTTGECGGENWIWYDYINDLLIPIQNACEQPWVGGVCPNDGCLAIGGRSLNYGWEADNCNVRRRYICQQKDETCRNQQI